MAVLLLIRHGDNEMTGSRLPGRLPEVHLNPHGREQAENLAQAMRDLPLSAIYSSPLDRTLETALPLSQVKNLPIQCQEGLIEVDFGDFSGKTFEELRQIQLWDQLHAQASSIRFPGGETLEEAQSRAKQALNLILSAFGKEDIVVCVTHADIVRLTVLDVLGLPVDAIHRLSVDTASVTMIETNDGKAVLRHFNQVMTPDGAKIFLPKK
jgi:probable phosphoglycerate mutase